MCDIILDAQMYLKINDTTPQLLSVFRNTIAALDTDTVFIIFYNSISNDDYDSQLVPE